MTIFIYVLITVIFLLFLLLYRYITINNNYWNERGIIFEKPIFFMGFMKDFVLRKKAMSDLYKEIYKKYPNEKIVGVLKMRTPELILIDLEVIKSVLVTDFNYFVDRSNFANNHRRTQNVFAVTSEVWKPMRQKFTLGFTTAKLKIMIPLIVEVGEDFKKYLNNLIKTQDEVECRELMIRLTIDIICKCAFGIEAKTIFNETNIFRLLSRRLFNLNFLTLFLQLLRFFSPDLFFASGILPLSKHTRTFLSIMDDTFKDRIISGKKRNDLIDLMLEMKRKEDIKNNDENNKQSIIIDEDFMRAHSLLFFGVGHKTTASALIFTLHELALHQEIQEKVYQEIQSTLKKYNGEITYDFIFELKYLDMVVDEALRKHPVITHLLRMCSTPYKFDGMKKSIDKGVFITVPICAIQNDPKYFPDPEKFIPERFTEEEKSKRHPMTYLPFGAGPRSCFGNRFGKIQTILGIVILLKDFSVEPCSKTVPNVKSDPRTILSSSVHKFWLKIKKRNEI